MPGLLRCWRYLSFFALFYIKTCHSSALLCGISSSAVPCFGWRSERDLILYYLWFVWHGGWINTR